MTLRTHPKRKSRLSIGLGLAIAVAALAPVAPASAAVTEGPGCTDGGTTITCEFWAVSGTKTLPGGGSVDVMGYSDTAGGAPLLPGPPIVADAGDTVNVTVHNTLTQPTGMLFQEQGMRPDTTGIAPGADNSATPYTFVASSPGTYLYEASPFVPTSAGAGSQYQTAMGMYGALVVRPSDPAQAYDANSAFNAEHLVVVGELDKALTLANAATFDMRDYAPDYFLFNGAAAPDTADLAAAAGDKVLLRMVNGGVQAHPMGLLGLDQVVVGEDGNALANPRHIAAETMVSGQTSDVIVNVPSSAGGRYSLYDSGLALNNGGAAGTGGMLGFLAITNSTTGDTQGPGTSNVAFDLGAGVLTASVSDAATGGSNVDAAEYFLDAPGAPGTGTPMSGTFPGDTVAVSYTFGGANPPFPAGSHTLYVRGRDTLGNWGPVSSVLVVNTDTVGPLTKALKLTPNPSNGSKNVLLSGTADDTDAGASDIAAGEFFIDTVGAPGTGTAMDFVPNVPADPIRAISSTIPSATINPAAFDEGVHTISVRSQDVASNWGNLATIDLKKDVTGPDTSTPTASITTVSGTPNYGAPPNQQFTIVRATVTDPPHHSGSVPDANSNVAGGEGFIDTVGANGTGFVLAPVDGSWDSPTENVRADVPLDSLARLSEGTHSIYLHGKDTSGNWGPASPAVTITVDKTGPVVSGLTATFNPTNVLAPNPFNAANGNRTTLVLAGTAADNFSSIAQAEWYTGADPGQGNGTPMFVSSGNLTRTINFVTPGWLDSPPDRTFVVRARDSLGNWGAPASIPVTIVRPNVIFQNAFPNGPITSFGRWASTTGAARLTFPGTGAARLMQVRVSGPINAANPAAAYVTDNTPVAEPTYHARFFFNPNNSNPGGGANGIGIFRGYTGNNGGGSVRFTVRYRVSGGSSQVLLEVVRTGGTTSTSWITIPSAAATPIEVFWQSGASASATFRVNGLNAPAIGPFNTGTGNRIESVRLGVVQGLAGAPATRSGSFQVDSFASARRTQVGP